MLAILHGAYRRGLGPLVALLWLAAGGPGYGQTPLGNGPEVVPIETRAWAHEDFGRLVFDWPWAVAYGAQREGTTLTVMFDRRLHTTFRQVPRFLGTYISDIALGADGQSVVATLTDAYRLRTFLLSSADGGVKVVVDLLADGEAGPSTGRTGPMLAQAPVPPSAEPSPEAVPGDLPSPPLSGDSLLPLAEVAPEAPPTELPPSLPFAPLDSAQDRGEADATPESGENPPRPVGPPLPRGDEEEGPSARATPPERGLEEEPPAPRWPCRPKRAEHPLLGGVLRSSGVGYRMYRLRLPPRMGRGLPNRWQTKRWLPHRKWPWSRRGRTHPGPLGHPSREGMKKRLLRLWKQRRMRLWQNPTRHPNPLRPPKHRLRLRPAPRSNHPLLGGVLWSSGVG